MLSLRAASEYRRRTEDGGEDTEEDAVFTGSGNLSSLTVLMLHWCLLEVTGRAGK